VAGLSTQSGAYRREVAERLTLSFPLLSDSDLRLTRVAVAGLQPGSGTGLRRRRAQNTAQAAAMVVPAGMIEHVFYPVFPPDKHAEEVLAWLRTCS
jgi:peroxiredoxin